MTVVDLFRMVIRDWSRRPDRTEALTLNQIASVSIGKGTSKNAQRVGQMVHEYGEYFVWRSARKVRVNWKTVERDHPTILAPRAPRAAADRPRGPQFDEMLVALDDERRAIEKDARESPIRISNAVSRPDLDPTKPIYEFDLNLGDRDVPLSIPDGAPVRLRWSLSGGRKTSRHGVLLVQDLRRSKVVVSLESPIAVETRMANGVLLPRTDELVAAVRTSLETVLANSKGLAHRLLVGDTTPSTVFTPTESTAGLLDESQVAAVDKIRTQDLVFLWGPPGTGKTHTLGEAITHLVRDGRRVLVLALANVAVDQVCLKTRDALLRHGDTGLLESGKLLRLGYAHDPEVLRDRRFFPDKVRSDELRQELREVRRRIKTGANLPTDERAQLVNRRVELEQLLSSITRSFVRDAKVVLTTVMQLCIGTAFEDAPPFDTVILDEASMVPIPQLLIAAHRARRQFVVAGDFRQLAPIALARSEAAQTWLHRDAFSLLGIEKEHPQHPALSMLTTQRRMHPDISACINSVFYGGVLRDEATDEATRSHAQPPLNGVGAVLIEVGCSGDCSVEATQGGSRRNLGTARRSARLAEWYAGMGHPVAVITPYRAQVAAIKKLLRATEQPTVRDEPLVHVGTIHTFQGSERDVVIWDLVENRHHKVGRLFRDDSGSRLSNVAITRAKGKLIVLVDPKVFIDAPGRERVGPLRGIISKLARTSSVPWAEVEALLPR